MIRDFIVNHPQDSIIFAVDDAIPEFRRKLVPEYKAHREARRKEDPMLQQFFEVYREQITKASDVLRPLGVHIVRSTGYEADDVIGACALVRYRKFHCMIFSEDKDFMQLVGDRCHMYRPSKGIIYKERSTGYLIRRAMIGDPSDGIKGVPQIGDVRSEKILESRATDDVDDFMESLSEDDKNEARVIQHEDVVRRNIKCMDLRRTAKNANRKFVIQQGKADKSAFMKTIKKFKMWELVDAVKSTFSPFESSNNFFEGVVL